MYYVKDGTSEIAGYAPYASRFTNGAYIHGVPVQYPHKNIIEYSPSLGTTPRSHMCVRNASSHAKICIRLGDYKTIGCYRNRLTIILRKNCIFGGTFSKYSYAHYSHICYIFVFSSLIFPIGTKESRNDITKIDLFLSDCKVLYEQMNLDGLVYFDTFKAAYAGYKMLNKYNNPLLTVIDFNLPSSEKRMYVLDMIKKKVLFVSYVSHGRNSGENYATSFSNRNGSHQSSLGFYRTAGTYQGGNGYSLLLDGLEKASTTRRDPGLL